MDSTPRHASVWMPSPPAGLPERPEGDLTADVVVIGAGITGLTAALLLAEANVRVVLLEARALGQGVTGRSTAQATEVLDHRYAVLAQKHGVEACRAAAAASRAAIDHIARWGRLHGARRMDRRPGYLFGESAEDRETLEREIVAMGEAGISATLEDRAPLPFATTGALRLDDQLQFDPYEYTGCLATAARQRGVRIFEGTRVIAVEDGSPCVVHTEGGVLRAAHVLLATHVPTMAVLRVQLKIAAYRSYVLAYPGNLASDGIFWDLADPYHYVSGARTAEGDVLLVGGADHKTGQEPVADPFAQLAAYARDKLGRTEAPSFAWSAQVEEPADGLPYIGPSSGGSHVFVATGYAGNGTTLGTVAGMLFADHVAGRVSPWSSVFDASRVKAGASAKEMLRENVDFPIHLFKDRLTGTESTPVAALARGEGKVVKVDGRRLAIHRDDQGELHAVSAVCTHMGCLVHFNRLEKSWDCPCHGSRFDVDGKVIDGPATRALAATRVPRSSVGADGPESQGPRSR